MRYQTDLTDGEWAVVGPLLPQPAGIGRPWKWPLRRIMEAVFYVLRTGCPWRLLPLDFPPRMTIWNWFYRFRDGGVFERTARALVVLDSEREGREASPSAAVMDSQSVKTTEAGGPRGYDGAKKVAGRKRHALARTDGRLMLAQVGPANVRDRDAAGPLVTASRSRFPFVGLVFADAGYQGPCARNTCPAPLEIIRGPRGQSSFTVQPRRWVVERSFAWFGRNRRLWKDAEATTASATAFLYAAATVLLVRRLNPSTDFSRRWGDWFSPVAEGWWLLPPGERTGSAQGGPKHEEKQP